MKVKIELSPFENEVFQRLIKYSKNTYIVGGSVRDTILGKPRNDVDIVTELAPDDVFQIFNDFYINPKGKFFGTVEIVYGDEGVEVSTIKKNIILGDTITVEFGNSIADDAKFRDFTINTLYVDYEWNLYDPLDGLNHLRKKLLVPVPTFNERMIADPIIIFRTARFVAQGFTASNELIEIISNPENHKRLKFPTPSRLASETKKALKSNFKRYLEFLHSTNALYYQFQTLEPYRNIIEDALSTENPLEYLAKNGREVLDTLYVPPNEYMKYLMKKKVTMMDLLFKY